MPTKKCSENRIFSESVVLKEAKHKPKIKKSAQVFRQCYVQQMHKISGKNSKPYFSWNCWKFSFFKLKTWFLVKNKFLSKIIHQYFSVQNQYNRTMTTLVLKYSHTLIKLNKR